MTIQNTEPALGAAPKPCDIPLRVTVQGGEIVILGPEGLSGAFTPEAAASSARRLLEAVESVAPSYQKPLG